MFNILSVILQVELAEVLCWVVITVKQKRYVHIYVKTIFIRYNILSERHVV
jgi:hypothetical protein